MLQSIAPDEPALINDASELMCWAPDAHGADGAPTAHGIEIARNAMAQAEAFAAAGRFEDAVLQLRVVEREMPRVGDRIAIRRGELLRKLHMPEQACEAFALALARRAVSSEETPPPPPSTSAAHSSPTTRANRARPSDKV